MAGGWALAFIGDCAITAAFISLLVATRESVCWQVAFINTVYLGVNKCVTVCYCFLQFCANTMVYAMAHGTAFYITVAVNNNFTFRLHTMVVARCERFRENGVLAIVTFYVKRRFRSVPFYGTVLHSVLFSHRFEKRQNANAHTVQRSLYEEGGMSWLRHQLKHPTRTIEEHVCFSILCMRSSANLMLIPYGAVLNRCMYRAVMNRTVSRSQVRVQP